jgi:uncharacterized protein (DUF2062 family)
MHAEAPHHNWIYRRIVLPILALLRMGATPQRLAWSIAVGAAIGVNPLIGTTTLLCFIIAFAFRLNVVAAQIANHVVFPLELALIVPLIRLSSRVFHSARMPLSTEALLEHVRQAPLTLLRQVWLWEWHAFLLWLLLAVALVPLTAFALTPLLERLATRVKRHEYPIVP